jgi:hypothetical protein
MLVLVVVLVLEMVGRVNKACFLPTAWRGAALACSRATSRYLFQRSIGPKNVATGGSRE